MAIEYMPYRFKDFPGASLRRPGASHHSNSWSHPRPTSEGSDGQSSRRIICISWCGIYPHLIPIDKKIYVYIYILIYIYTYWYTYIYIYYIYWYILIWWEGILSPTPPARWFPPPVAATGCPKNNSFMGSICAAVSGWGPVCNIRILYSIWARYSISRIYVCDETCVGSMCRE